MDTKSNLRELLFITYGYVAATAASNTQAALLLRMIQDELVNQGWWDESFSQYVPQTVTPATTGVGRGQ